MITRLCLSMQFHLTVLTGEVLKIICLSATKSGKLTPAESATCGHQGGEVFGQTAAPALKRPRYPRVKVLYRAKPSARPRDKGSQHQQITVIIASWLRM